jgi:hypothetical protein
MTWRCSSRRLLLNITPGADLALIGARSAAHGFRSGAARRSASARAASCTWPLRRSVCRR